MTDKKEETALVVQERIAFTQDQIDLVKRTVAKGTSDDEFALFMYQAKRTGLDPLSRQLHCVMRYNNKEKRNVMSIQTGIDGYRLIADRTGQYAGSDDYLFNNNQSPYDLIMEGNPFPYTATVTVYKIVQGHRVPFTATAEWSAYYPGDKMGFMWKKMPQLMLGKCAEALALRKAFPAELSGVYTREEMEQAGGEIIDVEINQVADAPPMDEPDPTPVEEMVITLQNTVTKKRKIQDKQKFTDFITEFASLAEIKPSLVDKILEEAKEEWQAAEAILELYYSSLE